VFHQLAFGVAGSTVAPYSALKCHPCESRDPLGHPRRPRVGSRL